MQAKKYKQSLRVKTLKQSLRPYGLRRKFYKKIPLLFLSLIFLSGFLFALLFFSNLIISKQIFFLSPLAQVKGEKNTDIERQLFEKNIQFSKIEENSIFLKTGEVVYIDLSKNLSSQISSLQLILSRLTIEGKKFKKLDLRYELPIIEF